MPSIRATEQPELGCEKIAVAPERLPFVTLASREAERAELHKTIWRIANDLRGSLDGWDFKSYVLGMLFYRFISENLTAYLNEQERGSSSYSTRSAT